MKEQEHDPVRIISSCKWTTRRTRLGKRRQRASYPTQSCWLHQEQIIMEVVVQRKDGTPRTMKIFGTMFHWRLEETDKDVFFPFKTTSMVPTPAVPREPAMPLATRNFPRNRLSNQIHNGKSPVRFKFVQRNNLFVFLDRRNSSTITVCVFEENTRIVLWHFSTVEIRKEHAIVSVPIL